MREERIPVAPGVGVAAIARDGADPPFLFVHGLASNARLWDGLAEALGHRSLAVDLRGHGQSDRPESGYDVVTVAADLEAVIEATGLERPVVAGQSWGANIVLELAFRSPHLVRGVVLVDGGWIDLQRRFDDWDACAAALHPPLLAGTPIEAIEKMLREMHPDWPETGIGGALANFEVDADGAARPWLPLDRHMAALRGLWEHTPRRRYPSVEVPVMLVPAAAGQVWANSKRSEIAAAEADLPRSRTHWFDADHDVHAQHPVELARVLLDALDDGFFA